MVRYAVTIFLGALLLFLVQPLIGKFILPWFGGGTGVWTVCLLFFQCTLVAGYAYAHGLVRLCTPRIGAIVHLVLLVGAIALLPIAPGEEWKPVDELQPTWRILTLLTVCLGGPFLLLASTGPLIQAWFVRARPDRSPYRLYALSNAGSLIGLLGYPFLIEPFMTRSVQATVWSWSFVLFAISCAWCAFSQLRIQRAAADVGAFAQVQPVDREHASHRSPTPLDRLLWLALPAVSTSMLLAVTSHVTEDIAPVPLLWVVPLAIYLLTFIVCFQWPGVYVRGLWAALLVISMLSSAVIAVAPQPVLSLLFASDALILLSGCMVCHGELYRRRPEPGRLTSYYLAIAIGGALGGAFVSLAAPLLFATYAEYIIALHAAAALLIVCVLLDPESALRRQSRARAAWFVFIALWIVVISANINAWVGRHKSSVENLRNFYGAMSLLLVGSEHPESMYMRLVHGRITHGIQIANPEYRMWPTTYYGVDSGIGRVLNQRPEHPRRVGIVGLGVGTLSTYGLPGDSYRFYEINPQVIRVADESFTYLSDARDRGATIEIIPGDARLSMEREQPQQYDVIVLDAFTGDAIPLHLLTREAFELYRSHLKPGGIIAVHISNRYLRLGRVVRAIAKSLGMHARIAASLGDEDTLVNASRWALVSDDLDQLENPELFDVLMPSNPDEKLMEPWTDEHASVMSVLEWEGVPLVVPSSAPQSAR